MQQLNLLCSKLLGTKVLCCSLHGSKFVLNVDPKGRLFNPETSAAVDSLAWSRVSCSLVSRLQLNVQLGTEIPGWLC